MRAAIWQANSGVDPAANAAALTRAMERAKADGADMLFTPEMTGCLDRNRKRAAETLRTESTDAVLAHAREEAARLGLWLHIGSLGLIDDARQDDRWVNRAFVIDGGGDIRARYDKIHLFDVDLPTGESWRESSAYAPGSRVVAVDTPWARLGLSICYDIRFPDLYRALSDAGCTLLLVPAAFTVPTGQAHWHLLLRARAVEATAFVLAAAQAGTHQDGRATYGHSLAVDPWGDVLLDMGDTPDSVACVDLDFARLADVRTRLPSLAHRRALSGEVDLS